MTATAETTERNAGGPRLSAAEARRRGWRRLGRPAGLLLAAIVVAAGSYVVPLVRDALPPAPAAPARVVVPVPGQAATPDGRLPLADRIAFWTQRVAEQPTDDLSLLQLATAWAEQGRLHVDLDAYARALEAAHRALAIAPAYPPGLAVRASIRYATHDFAGAEADARAALKGNPRDPIALAVLGDSVLELGRTAEAATIYDELAAVAGGPALDVRRARLAYLTGSPDQAVELARKALVGASGGGPDGAATSDPIELAFYHDALGEYARLAGGAATARSEFEAALALRTDDLAGRLGLARVAAAGGRTDEAIRRLEEAAAIAPLPEVEALLGDLRAAAGDTSGAAVAYDTVRLTSQLSQLSGVVFDRILIGFELDHGGASESTLAQARAALARRADPAGHDLVAWALHRLGREDEAWAASLATRAGGIRDARILFHAGAIALARGERATGEALLRQALDLGPALDPADRAEALELLAAG